MNERRLEVMNQCRQSQISRGFSLILDDSGHRKSGNFTAGVGRQYLGEIGKTDNGIVVVTTHLYDGKKHLPLDIELYQPKSSLTPEQVELEFQKKPELGLKLIDDCLKRKHRPGLVLIDSGYGNNSSFLLALEQRKLKYLGGLAKNRLLTVGVESDQPQKLRLDQWAQSLSAEDWKQVSLNLDKPKTVWVATIRGQISGLPGERTVAIVMNHSSFNLATEVDYLITNVAAESAIPEWFVSSYSQRNWVEVFYREAKGWLGLKEYQVRQKTSLLRHFTLVFCAYSFIIWHKLTGGLRRKWASKPLNTFTEALEAFRTAMSFRFFKWLKENEDVFTRYKASLGFIWA